jgi:hypothetical protein
MYQHRLPQVTVNWPTAPQAEKYTLKIGSRTVETAFPYHTFPFLARGRHSVVFSARASPPRQSRTTTIDVVLDTQAPAARVVEGSPGAADSVTLSGQTMPGWNVAIGDEKIEVDGKQGFSVDVDGDSTVPIRFSHPDRDTHYYLRRPKASP